MMFLFLIGKVLTLAISPSQPELGWAMFPFLIGKVLTETRAILRDWKQKFPFLIGKVLTTAFKPL